jgi:hypothetical protein
MVVVATLLHRFRVGNMLLDSHSGRATSESNTMKTAAMGRH